MMIIREKEKNGTKKNIKLEKNVKKKRNVLFVKKIYKNP